MTWLVVSSAAAGGYALAAWLRARGNRRYRARMKARIERYARRGMNSHLSGDGR